MNTAAEPRLPTVGRYVLSDPGALVPRQLTWMLAQGALAAGLVVSGLSAAQPALAVAAGLAIAAALSAPRRLRVGGLTAVVAIAAVGMTELLPGTAALAGGAGVSGLQVLLAGAVVGAGAAWVDGGPVDRWRLVQSVLAGVAFTGLGWWAADRLVGGMPSTPLAAALHGAIFGLLASQTAVVAALRFRAVQRIPKPARIKSTLSERYQAPCLKARRLDDELAHHAPDADTRDGLGEVAAWIYKLQWTLQIIDREIDTISEMDLQDRIIRLYEDAELCEDDFTRERQLAAAQHLEQLTRHREGLAVERQRVAALVEYAAAYQEEARGGLILARMQPGDYVPARLDDVLGRLRAHAQERLVQRRTAREVAQLVSP